MRSGGKRREEKRGEEKRREEKRREEKRREEKRREEKRREEKRRGDGSRAERNRAFTLKRGRGCAAGAAEDHTKCKKYLLCLFVACFAFDCLVVACVGVVVREC